MWDYVWMRLPLILLFANGYLIHRLCVVTRLTDTLVLAALQRSGGNFYSVLLYVMGISALLSFFIPNAVTVLTLLPVVKTIVRQFEREKKTDIITPLTLCLIYGANIGGMGAIVGSPANLLLIGQMDLLAVPGRESISFFNWFIWSIPLVAALVLIAWGIIVLITAVSSLSEKPPSPTLQWKTARLSRKESQAAWLFGLFVGFWTVDAILKEMMKTYGPWEPLACALFFAWFGWLSLGREMTPGGKPLLPVTSLVQDIPKRGILFLGVLIAIMLGIRFLSLDETLSRWMSSYLPIGMSPFRAVLSIALIVTFLTEILSNTMVSMAFFPIAHAMSEASGISAMVLMIAVSTSSTCAFMTPIATPCNALAYGEMRGVSLAKMLFSGAILNIAGALLMAGWLPVAIPRVYGLP